MSPDRWNSNGYTQWRLHQNWRNNCLSPSKRMALPVLHALQALQGGAQHKWSHSPANTAVTGGLIAFLNCCTTSVRSSTCNTLQNRFTNRSAGVSSSGRSSSSSLLCTANTGARPAWPPAPAAPAAAGGSCLVIKTAGWLLGGLKPLALLPPAPVLALLLGEFVSRAAATRRRQNKAREARGPADQQK